MINWRVHKIINFGEQHRYQGEFAHVSFHDFYGRQYTIDYDNHWIGCLENGRLSWTAGRSRVAEDIKHFTLNLTEPKYVSGAQDGSVIIAGERYIYRVFAEQQRTEVVLDKDELGMADIGNCVYDDDSNIWINEVTGCRVWQLDYYGRVLHRLGQGKPGFQLEDADYDQVAFNWIYDLRKGTDGNIYVLDSKNYAVRMIDINRRVVKLVSGTGRSGYSGDGGNALDATYGGNEGTHFDGPWALSLDEENNIFIGDTQNHVVRMIHRGTNTISTIAGDSSITSQSPNNPHETDLFKLKLNLICSMNYHKNRLFIPEWEGDLVVLEKNLTMRL